MEAGPARGNGGADLREHPPSAPGGDDHTFEIKRLCSSSSSEPSSSGDSFELAVKETSASNAGSHDHFTHDDGQESVPRHGGGGDIPVSSMPKIESPESGLSDSMHDLKSDNGSAKQLPPIQVMERTGDVTGSPSPYRIPSSVFARTKSTAPMEWSTASNESLFSIQMGNASFTRDQMYWVGKSQELSMYGAPPIPPAPMDYANPTPVNKPTEIGLRTTNTGEHQSAPTPAAHPPEDPKESVNHSKGNFPWPEVTYSSSPSHHSDASGASVKSFAFPILSRDAAKSGSLSVGPNGMKPLTSFAQAKSEPQTPKPPSPKAASAMGQARWFSCFPCCSICSSG